MQDRWDPQLYDARHGFIAKYGEDVVALLNPQPGERILDLGCGTGRLTALIAASGAEVIGLDRSAAMVEQARASYPHIEFVVSDAANFRLERSVDAVFSNATLHWITRPEAPVARVWEALRPGGRFVGEMGGKGNIAAILRGISAALKTLGVPPPDAPLWYYPTLGEYAALLERQGFHVSMMAHFERPTPLEGADALRHWLIMFVPHLLDRLPDGARDRFFERVEEEARPALWWNGVWYADYVRLRFAAEKPTTMYNSAR